MSNSTQFELSNGQLRCQEVWGDEAPDHTIRARSQCSLPVSHAEAQHYSAEDDFYFSDSLCIVLRCDTCPCSYAYEASDVGRRCGDLERWWAAGCPKMRAATIQQTYGCNGRKIITFEYVGAFEALAW